MKWLERLFHRHEWRDWYVFDSCIQYSIPSGNRRILGQAVMMYCDGCGKTERRPLKTWAEARQARKVLPYPR